jgi:hypothetical protein
MKSRRKGKGSVIVDFPISLEFIAEGKPYQNNCKNASEESTRREELKNTGSRFHLDQQPTSEPKNDDSNRYARSPESEATFRRVLGGITYHHDHCNG